MKILIAEDDELMAKALETKLKLDGYTVIIAKDGRSALKFLETEKPDLIITDIMMPLTSGLELLSIVKSDLNNKIPVIVLSGMDEEKIVLQAFEMGADDFLTKPFNSSELSLRVKRFAIRSRK